MPTKREQEEQNAYPVATGSSLMDGQEQTSRSDGQITKGSVLRCESQAEHDDLEHACAVQGCGGSGSNQGDSRVSEQTWLTRVDCEIRK